MVASGMTDGQIRKCHERLERFLVDLLEPVGRSERRHWGAVYVRGLLLDGERKSVEPMASRLPDGNVQAMQQFVGQSPWDWKPIWERLGRRMTAELEPESAWVIDDTGFPKQGDHSVGVERQYSGTLGKTGNCQVAVSLHHVGAQGSAVLNWRLYLPERRNSASSFALNVVILAVCGANDASYPTRRGAGVSPAMPVFLPAFPEERRHGRRRRNLKGRSTSRARRSARSG
jgi:hypothetical protein